MACVDANPARTHLMDLKLNASENSTMTTSSVCSAAMLQRDGRSCITRCSATVCLRRPGCFGTCNVGLLAKSICSQGKLVS